MTRASSDRIIVSVIGRDRVGIISAVSGVIAAAGGNVLDISQSVMQEFFVMIMMVDVGEASVPFAEIKETLRARGDELGLQVDAQHEDVFNYMHRI